MEERPRRCAAMPRDLAARSAVGLEGPAEILGDAASFLVHRLLARHHAGRRHCRILHGLQPRQALFQGPGQLWQGPHRGRVRAGNRGACVRHRGAAADAGARHSRLRHRGDPARRLDGVGPQPRAAAVRRAQGFRLGPDRLDVSRQCRRPRAGADDGADLCLPSCGCRSRRWRR
jgi:hypothetical protein